MRRNQVDSAYAPHGDMGQKYLATGIKIALRLWENESPEKRSRLHAEIMKRSALS